MIMSLRHLLGWAVSAFSSRESLILENLALRQRVLALHTKRPRRRLTALHKLFWVVFRDRYVENSLFFYLNRVETPLLILHDSSDPTVPGFLADQVFRRPAAARENCFLCSIPRGRTLSARTGIREQNRRPGKGAGLVCHVSPVEELAAKRCEPTGCPMRCTEHPCFLLFGLVCGLGRIVLDHVRIDGGASALVRAVVEY